MAQSAKAIAAIVPAAGCGARAGLSHNKILAPLCGQPLLYWTLRALCNADDAKGVLPLHGLRLQQILIAARREEFGLIAPLISDYSPLITVVEGGETRQQSVWNAARHANAEYFLVHDAARPLVSPELIARVCNAAKTSGAAICALPAGDTVKSIVEKNGTLQVASTLDRRGIYLAQTPQVFAREVFLEALECAAQENFDGTDCASLVERIGREVVIVEGEADNFKVTYAADLERAEVLLQKRVLN